MNEKVIYHLHQFGLLHGIYECAVGGGRIHCTDGGDNISIVGVVTGVLIVVIAMTGCWFLANLVVPQSEIEKIDAIGRWAKEELERRETEGREAEK